MKKNGFTLAEVLITLAIIGVVATMTLPALMNNTGEQQYITGLKKGINTLTEAAQLSKAIDNVDFSNIVTDDEGTALPSATLDPASPTLYALINSRISVDPLKSTQNRTGSKGAGGGANNYAIFFRDGAALYYPKTQAATDVKDLKTDGLVGGIRAVYDVNGMKGPNVLSNCSGNVAGVQDAYTEGVAENPCNDITKRVIGDQFAIRLRGNIAVPNGNAARWAFEK